LALSAPRGAVTAIAWALFAVMAIAFVVVARASNDAARRGVEYMPDMSYSLPYNTFAPNPITRDGKTLQPPVPGTVPRDVQPFRYGATPDEALRAGRELRNPVAPSAAALTEGRALYETFCLVCHGERGQGDGPLVPRIPNPPSYTSQRVREMAPGQLFHVISRGSGRMPSYAAQISYDQRWLIVLYVSALRDGKAPPP
jgi:mono/diheme cytochrome c family protein